MVSFVNLRQTGQRWEFESEAALEDFVWANLKKLLRLTPLKRQYRVNGQICDIIAADENKRLVVLELKNVEDRGIVQQLTRYYDALLEEKPFKEEIDYGQSVHLVAITPNFHKDNLIDKKYHKLFFQFLCFEVSQNKQSFYLQLKDIDTEKLSRLEIIHQKRDSTDNIPNPPRALVNLIAKCTPDEREAILRIREKILKFDRRIQEITDAGSINYGRGKSKPCAELRFDRQRNSPALFLWMPLVSSGWKKRKFVARMRVWSDWQSVSNIGHVPKALGTMITITELKSGNVRPLANLLPTKKESREKFLKDKAYRERCIDASPYKGVYEKDESYKSPLAMSITHYMKLIEKPEESYSLEVIVNIALEKWLERL